MSSTTYPTANDLQRFLVASGFINNPLIEQEAMINLQGALDSVRTDWEDRTGWKPFLKDANDVTRYYDPPGHPQRGGNWFGSRGGLRILELRAGLMSCTSVTIGYSRANPAAQPGTLLTVNSDYILRPTEAAYTSQPYEQIEFLAPQYGLAESIVVVGKWGKADTVPASVWQAHLFGAALWLMPGLYGLPPGGMGIGTIKLSDDEFTFNGRMDEVNMMRAQYEKTLKDYIRIRL